MEEFLPVDPNRAYRLTCYVQQEALAGDWSAFSNAENHKQSMGFICYDVDRNKINAEHHKRYIDNGIDSRTTLAAPLTPGDNIVVLTDATGWNDSDSSSMRRGIIVFAYKNAGGGTYTDYSRIVEEDLFELGDVNKTSGTVVLNKPFSASMGNPDDPSGTWPAGTVLANASNGSRSIWWLAKPTPLRWSASGPWLTACLIDT
jgi:hypothetical protein